MRLRALILTVVGFYFLSPLIVRGETRLMLDVGFGIRYVPPSRVCVPVGEYLAVTAPSVRDGVWFKDGVALPDKTDPTLVIRSAAMADGGVYFYAFPGTQIPENPPLASQQLRLTVGPAQRFLNLSTRGLAGSGAQTLIAGFVVQGDGEKTILVRVVGPTLAQYGVPGVLQRPMFRVFDSAGKEYDSSFVYPAVIGSGHEEHIRRATEAVGAFPLPAGSNDAVDIRPFAPGAYTLHVNSVDASAGIVLVELYEVPE